MSYFKCIFWALLSALALAYSNPNDEILDSVDVKKYYAAEFQDGIGAIWNGHMLISKKLVETKNTGIEPGFYEDLSWNIPEEYTQNWPDFYMRGVISCGGDYYDTLKDVITGEFTCSNFYVYEVPNQPGDLAQRLDFLKQWLNTHNVHNIKIINQKSFQNKDELEDFFNKAVAKGKEGIVLATKSAEYNSKSFSFLTVRKFYKDLCVITTVNYDAKGLLSSYECEWQTANGYRAASRPQDRERLSFLGPDAIIKVSSGFSDEHKHKPLKVGTQIGFRYSSLDDSGLPSRPYFLKDF